MGVCLLQGPGRNFGSVMARLRAVVLQQICMHAAALHLPVNMRLRMQLTTYPGISSCLLPVHAVSRMPQPDARPVRLPGVLWRYPDCSLQHQLVAPI